MRACAGLLALSLTLSLACMGKGIYTCSSHDQCFEGRRTGRCEATRYCSFPDPSCRDTQYRYGEHADPSIAEQCVEAIQGNGGYGGYGGDGLQYDGGTAGGGGSEGMCANDTPSCTPSAGTLLVRCSGTPGDWRCNCIDNEVGQVVACCRSTSNTCDYPMCCFQ
jgi:hypothetical protein